MKALLSLPCFLLISMQVYSQSPQRARDWRIPFDGTPGTYNNITDVKGVEVGYTTLIQGEGKLNVGEGPIRTGVTVILPAGKSEARAEIPAGICSFNGDGELTGAHFINDYGFIPSAVIGVTNTNSVGVVRDAIGAWQIQRFAKPRLEDFSFGLPVVGETWDGDFNDINGLHVKKEHVFAAIESATSGEIAEGNVGGGTGMWLYGFKGGTGSASRVVEIDSTEYTVGVLVQANFGYRADLMVAGVPVGKLITGYQPVFHQPRQDGSIIAIVATDAPILPLHLRLVARRVGHGIARTGAFGGNGSGDIFLAFSTAQPTFNEAETKMRLEVVPKWELDPIFRAVVQATEEAILNALIAAETLKGVNDNIMYECPEEELVEILKRYGRIE